MNKLMLDCRVDLSWAYLCVVAERISCFEFLVTEVETWNTNGAVPARRGRSQEVVHSTQRRQALSAGSLWSNISMSQECRIIDALQRVGEQIQVQILLPDAARLQLGDGEGGRSAHQSMIVLRHG